MKSAFLAGLPQRFVRIITAMPHFDGRNWLAEELPETIRMIEKKWDIRVGRHYPNLSYNYVARCFFADGREAVLKIGLPEEDSELFDEARALEVFNGRGAVRLLEFDRAMEALLLEKITPGRNLKEMYARSPLKAVRAGIDLLKKILRKPPGGEMFPSLDQWIADFEQKRNVLPDRQFEEAAALLQKLRSEANQQRLLHGDFHHENILSSHRDGFLTIDPVGIVGDTGYEIAVFLNEHARWLRGKKDLKKSLAAAVGEFSEAFGISEANLRKWAFVQMILASWWDFEDRQTGWQDHLDLAELWK